MINEYSLPEAISLHYLNRYIKFISSIKNTDNTSITEKHHILPKSMGGLDHPGNLIDLTPRQHYLAHWMLWKAYKSKQMTATFFSMNNRVNPYCQRNFIPNSRIYQKVREDFLKEISDSTSLLWQDPEYRRKHQVTNSSIKTRQLRSEKARELWKNLEYREKITLSRKKAWAEGRIHRDHSKCGNKGELNVAKRPEVRFKNTGKNHYSFREGFVRPTCPHCGLTSTPVNIKRWHGDKCKKFKS
jgi:hypothetical protein